MKNEPETFTLTISGTKGAEWQGLLKTAAGETLLFRSSLELLREINTQMLKKAEQK
jgi:hypothetical protein